MTGSGYPETPDRRYFVAKARLWRKTDPSIPEDRRDALIRDLMAARRAVRDASTAEETRSARSRVDAAKRALGERGPVWWTDGQPDEGGKHPKNTSYAAWWSTLDADQRHRGEN